MAPTPLADAFLAALDEAARSDFEALGDLEERLAHALQEAAGAWPDIELDAAAFMQHLAGHAPAERPAEELFERLHSSDLYLALGCTRGDAAAVAGFHREFGPDIESAIRRFSNLPVSPDDMRQILHEKLLVGRQDRAPKLAEYAGLGFLQNWLRVAAVRTLTDLARSTKRRRETAQDDFSRVADDGDLELSFLKKHYRQEFKQAFEAAARTLSAADRNLLRHNAVQGLSIDQLAAVYSIHRATAARRLAKAREALLAATRAQLQERVRVGRDEFDSLMHLIGSNLEVSICRILGSHGELESPGDAADTSDG